MTSDNGSPVASLPTEVLRAILCLATPPAIQICSSESPPFGQKPGLMQEPEPTLAVLRDKTSIVLVCRFWRAIATEFLYEDLVVKFDRLQELLELFRTTSAEDPAAGYGRYVRCIRTHLSSGTWQSGQITDFFRYCPNIRVLCKADITSDEGFWCGPITTQGYLQSACMSLSAIFWGCSGHGQPSDLEYDFLLNLLKLSPNVRFLSIPCSPKFIFGLLNVSGKDPLAGKNISYLEFQPAYVWNMTSKMREALMTFYPNVSEISQYVGRPRLGGHSGVSTFRFHLPPTDGSALMHAPRELTALAGPGLPSLQRVFLHGDWSSVFNLRAIEQNLVDQGRQVIFVDGEDSG
ncbi:hypothetical protein C8R44DRAFT_790704 [Mycena epipterygia]|nr:hypothetical protein C8R44DRAFT_790704 [Mycena epipterygia]